VTGGYRPIEDYGAIGNLRTVALVSRDGSIDWCCLPDLDDPSIFAALLDAGRGGLWHVRPAGRYSGRQRYIENTNVLETTYDVGHAQMSVTDFMPLSGSIEGFRPSDTESAICRLLTAAGGTVEVDVLWIPRLDYARGATLVARAEAHYRAACGDEAITIAGLPGGAEILADRVGPLIRARFILQDGERRALVTNWGTEVADARVDVVQRKLAETLATWRGWVCKEEATGDRAWAEPYGEQVIRSELALKLLTHSESGAFAAAATTSLPEEIGGVRNWDYRIAWIRDAAQSAQALFALGHRQDAQAFVDWAEGAADKTGRQTDGLRILYGLKGDMTPDERDLPNLEGYRRSSPVRVGNGAAGQLQLDIYGELIEAAYELVRMGGRLSPETASFLAEVADQACAQWQQPDYGIWELRSGPFHFVYSKVMVWTALDRAIRLSRRGVLQGDVTRWRRTRDAIRAEVLDRGFDRELGAFKQAYDRRFLDASNLLLPVMEFLPFSDPRVQANLDKTMLDLTENGLVYRYHADDGIAGREGAFVLCTFWLVDALALSDRMEEAYRVFEGLLSRVNHVGLYSEQIDPVGGGFLGNFPQAYSHIGLINSALYLAYKEDRETPVPAPVGSEAHRAEGVTA
jgi:GH15 family glucan-1,4-alpha-glucosidase